MSIAGFKPDPGYAGAFVEMMSRLALMVAPGTAGWPVRICIAGGAALHLYTGSRYTDDVDARLFARAMIDPSRLRIAYRDRDGHTRMLYYDTQYNDTFALMHVDAYDDAIPVQVAGVDAAKLAVSLLAPVDLAVSKLARFHWQDREDIRTLAREGLITADAMKARALDALPDYVGHLERIRNTIEIAAKDVAVIQRQG